MSESPERIWAWYFMRSKQNEFLRGGWTDQEDHRETPYIRADKVAELEAEIERMNKAAEVGIRRLLDNLEAERTALAAERAKVAKLVAPLKTVSASFHQLSRERDLSEVELDFMRCVDAALSEAEART